MAASGGKGQQEEDLIIVVRGLPEGPGEDTTKKLNEVLTGELKLKGAPVSSAERKVSRNDRYPGLVIAKCKTRADKDLVMKSKAQLRKSTQYNKVMIDHNKSAEQRAHEANMRLLVNTVGKDKLVVRGGAYPK